MDEELLAWLNGIHLAARGLCSIGEEEGEGGAGGAGGAGGGEADKPLTRADVERLVSSTVNTAITSHLKRGSFTKTLGETIKTELQSALQGLKATPGDDDEVETPAPADKQQARGDSEAAKLRKRIQELEDRDKARDAESKAQAEKRMRLEERSELTKHLLEAGIPKERLGGAAAYLLHDLKKVRRNEEGDIVWPEQVDGVEEELDLERGVARWLATDEGKAYLPATGAGGSGAAANGKAPGKGKGKATLQDLGALLMKGSIG